VTGPFAAWPASTVATVRPARVGVRAARGNVVLGYYRPGVPGGCFCLGARGRWSPCARLRSRGPEIDENEVCIGCWRGRSSFLLVDRESGGMLGVTLFDSEEAMRWGDEAMNTGPGQAVSRASVEFYEVPVHIGFSGRHGTRRIGVSGAAKGAGRLACATEPAARGRRCRRRRARGRQPTRAAGSSADRSRSPCREPSRSSRAYHAAPTRRRAEVRPRGQEAGRRASRRRAKGQQPYHDRDRRDGEHDERHGAEHHAPAHERPHTEPEPAAVTGVPEEGVRRAPRCGGTPLLR
jgi:hypothetical protein